MNICKTCGVCVVIFSLPLSGCSSKTEFERTVERATAGDKSAQTNLGLMYDKGDGVPQDYAEAYAWFFVAATGGSINAEKYRDTVKEILTAEQLAEAQKRANELFEKYGSGK